MGYLDYMWTCAGYLNVYSYFGADNTKQIESDKEIKENIIQFILSGDPRHVTRCCTLRVIVDGLDYTMIKDKLLQICTKDSENVIAKKITKVMDYLNRDGEAI